MIKYWGLSDDSTHYNFLDKSTCSGMKSLAMKFEEKLASGSLWRLKGQDEKLITLLYEERSGLLGIKMGI